MGRRANHRGPGPPLVTAEWLSDHLDDPAVVVVEVAFDPPEQAAYFTVGHVPTAHYAWWKDLCWHASDREFPSPPEMASRLEALGVSDRSQLVLVGDSIQFATYTYWVLVMTGLAHLARVLDGGRSIWERQGRPLSSAIPPTPVVDPVSVGRGDSSSRVGRNDILEHLEDPGRVLVDMRSDEEYRGERVAPVTAQIDHGAERKGRIPGARHLHYERLLDENGCFLPAEDMEAIFESVGAGRDADVVTYCRLSHRATLGWFAATVLAGRTNHRVYDGSWTEWGSIVGFPVEVARGRTTSGSNDASPTATGPDSR